MSASGVLHRVFSQAEAWARRISATARESFRVLKDSVMPSPPFRVGIGGAGTLHLHVSPTSLRAESIHAGVVTWAGEAPYASLDDLTEAIARLAAEPARPCRRLTVRLERPLVQIRTLTDLPPVKPANLGALVAHQAGRFFRKNGRPLVTDAVWIKNGHGPAARAAAVEEPVLEAIVAGARAAGLALDAIAPAGEAADLSLLPTAERTARAHASRARVRRLASATGAVWIVVGFLFVARLAWERRAVERDLANAQAPLAAVLAARRELRDAETTVNTIRASEARRGAAAATLDAVARALPDSAVLTSLTLNADGSGVLSGAARRAADVLARVERGGALRAPRLEGPVVRETVAGREWERFTIVFGGGGRER